MIRTGLGKLFWGFLFIMITFRSKGFDILPDAIGYLLFAFGFYSLSGYSIYFRKAFLYSIPLVMLSFFTFYQPAINDREIKFWSYGSLSIFLSIVALIINLLTVYYLFRGMCDIEERQEQNELALESKRQWCYYLILQLVNLFALIFIFIPIVSLVFILVMLMLFIATLAGIMRYIKKCRDSLKNES